MPIGNISHDHPNGQVNVQLSHQNCDLPTLNLLLGHICKTGTIYPWTWDFGEYFDLVFTSPTGQSAIKKKTIQSYFQTVHPDDMDRLANGLIRFARERQGNIRYRFRSTYLSEAFKWYEITGEIVGGGELAGQKAIGFIQDVHGRVSQRAENHELLTKAKEEAEIAKADRDMALNNLNTALVYVNREFIVRWSSMEAMKKILGENSYAKGLSCYKSTFGRSTPCEDCPVRRMFASNKTETKRLEMHGEIVEVTVNPVYKNNEIIGGILKLDKITERVKQELIIQNLNVLMDAILNHIPVSLFVKDPNDDFKYLYWNKALADSFQIPMSEVIGRTDQEVFTKEGEIERFRQNDNYVLENRTKISFIDEYTRPDGETIVSSSIKTIIPGGKNKKPLILGISWDITEMKRVEKELIRLKEKAEESNRLKSSFLANMSHEIRTPLNAIVGFSELLEEVDSAEERADYINIIKRNNNLLLQLISDILDLSKIEAQSLEFNFASVDVYKLVSQIVTANNIHEDTSVPVILDDYIPKCLLYTDKNRVNQVLSNFINNALKFTSTGEIAVGYHLHGDNGIKFYVKDTGVGIEPDKLDKIFDRFIKLDSFKQGTGLGLSISKSIIEQLGGTIGVESERGKGSCFWFVLPYTTHIN